MRCAWVQHRVLLYVEGELRPLDRRRVAEHLERCPGCMATHKALVATQEVVAGALRTTAPAPATLDDKVMSVVRRIPARRGARPALRATGTWRVRIAWAVAAVALLFGGYVAGRWHAVKSPAGAVPVLAAGARQPQALALSLLGDDHLEYLGNPAPAQVPGPDARAVSRAMTMLLEFPVAAVDLEPEGARLLGGRRCQVQGVPVAFLLYDWRGERVSLYQIDGRRLAVPALREVIYGGRRFDISERDGLRYVAWRSGSMHFVMVSSAEPEALLQLANRACSGHDHA